MSMSVDDRREFVEDIDGLKIAISILTSRVNALESELQDLRDAATSDDAPRSLASVIGEAADWQRYMKTH